MGLDAIITTALSGLSASQENLSVISQNIANVNTPNYSERIVNQVASTSGSGGVDIASIARNVDDTLVSTIRTQESQVGMANTIASYNGDIQNLVGTPNTSSNINDAINNFFTSLSSLAASPQTSALQGVAVNSAVQLSTQVSSLANGLQSLRFQADNDITSTINNINTELNNIADDNANIFQAAATNNGLAPPALLDQRDADLQALAQNIGITVHYAADGTANVSTTDGKPLLIPGVTYQLNYDPASSVTQFSQNAPVNPITITPQGVSPLNDPYAITLVTGGLPSAVTSSSVTSGNLAGLLQMRDSSIPQILTQLDNLATNITTSVNAIQNNGAGFPAATSLTGSTAISANTNVGFTGSVMIGVVDQNGQPITQPNGQPLDPLTLNLGQLNSGNGPGNPTVQTIINAINQQYYYDPVEPTTSVGNLSNIQMVATSNNLTPGGTFSFDFDLQNNSSTTANFNLQSIQVVDSNGNVIPQTAPYGVVPGGTYNANADTDTQTGQPVSVNFAGGTGPFTIQATMQVTNSNGTVSNSTVSFPVNDSPSNPNVMNNYYLASAVTGDGVITPSGTTQRYAFAQLVDSNGVPIAAGSDEPGYIQISTQNGTDEVAINELDSNQVSVSTNPKAAATNQGFSQYFGLNNLFVPNQTVAGSAQNMQVRPDIVNSPNLISMGQLTPSTSQVESETEGDLSASGTMIFTANPNAGDTITVNGQVFTYVNGPTALPNQIQLGVSLPLTLTNTVAKLSGVNSYTQNTVDQATYTTDGINTLSITAAAPGTGGNQISLSAQLSVPATINGGISSDSPQGFLAGGTNQQVNQTVTPPTYQLGAGNSNIINQMANLGTTNITFAAAGGLARTGTTLSSYSTEIIAFTANAATNATSNQTVQQTYQDGYTTKLQDGSGVNLDEELANTILYQNSYAASAKIISTTQALFDDLFGIFNPSG